MVGAIKLVLYLRYTPVSIQFLTILALSYTAFLYSKTTLYSAVYVARGRKLRKRRGKEPFKKKDIIRIYKVRRIKYNRMKSTSNVKTRPSQGWKFDSKKTMERENGNSEILTLPGKK